MSYDNDNGFHGTRYLLDAKNKRQYAVMFMDGKPRKVDVFAADEREAVFKPNEVIYAFDDDIQISKEGGDKFASAMMYQITTDETGKPKNVKYQEVSYHIGITYTPGELEKGVDVNFTITKGAADKLKEAGFDTNFPKKLIEHIPSDDPALIRKFDEEKGEEVFLVKDSLYNNLTFPPQHDGAAIIARMAMEGRDGGTEMEERPSILDAFNNGTKTGTTTQPKTPTTTKPVKYRVPDAAIETVLKTYCRDLTGEAENGRLDPVVGRDEETDQAIKVLTRRKQASLCFTGPAGAGKTAMFSAVAQRIADGRNVPPSLEGARVMTVDLEAMNAGAKFRGQFEEKLKPLIDGLQERNGYFRGRRIILALDEIQSQLTAGKAEGGTNAGNMMKPFLTSPGIAVMGTTTEEEYRQHIEKDPALASRFEQLVVNEPKKEVTLHILNTLWPLIKAHHGMAQDLSPQEMEYLVNISSRYSPDQAQPRKGEKVLDTAAAAARFRGSDVIERQDIISAVSQLTKLSTKFLSQDDSARFLEMEKVLPEKILGQPGIQKVVDGLIGARSGLADPNQPWGCFVFQGPTGVGKTELCKELGRFLFDDENAISQFNMSEYADKHTVSRLIGAPPGFVGFDSSEPGLTEKVRQRPFQIILFDEIEKAHPDIFNILLPILNDGRTKDNKGNTVLFNNTIIIMTTNLGAKEAMSLLEGNGMMAFGKAASLDSAAKTESELEGVYKKERKKFFRPEMINRVEELGGFVTFLPLKPEVVAKLVDREIEKVGQRLTSSEGADIKGVSLEVSAAAREQLCKDGYDRAMGARPLRKIVREQVGNPLGKWLMMNRESLVAAVAKNGAVKLVIDKLGADFAPVMVADKTKGTSNDNKSGTVAGVAAAAVAKAATKRVANKPRV